MAFEPRNARGEPRDQQILFRCTKSERKQIEDIGHRAGKKTTADAMRHIIADYFERHPQPAASRRGGAR